MKNLCADRKRLNLPKAWERVTCFFSETALQALYQLSVHHITTLWSAIWARWQIRIGWTTCHCRDNAKIASGYQWSTGQSLNLAALRAGTECSVCLRLIASCRIVSPFWLSHTHRVEWRWLLVTGFEKQPRFQLSKAEVRRLLMVN